MVSCRGDSSARARRLTTAALSLVALAACSDAGPIETPNDPVGSFARIQTQIFDVSCTSCHTAGNSNAQQSGLVLTTGMSYAQLVGAAPREAHALAEGLQRVAAGNPERSLLYHKVNAAAPDAEHYGSTMPLGGEPLYIGQIEFIRRWIAAGAPRTGEVADTMLLQDRTRPNVTPFQPLAVPASGVQLRIEPFTVQPNFERELFVLRRVGNSTPIYVNRIETRMRSGSHHLLVQTFREGTPALFMPQTDVIRDIRNSDGSMNFSNMLPMAYHVFFGGAMTQYNDYRLPAGVALLLPANAVLDLNTHYVNRTPAAMTGEAYVNLHTVPLSQVTRVARTLDLGSTDITLPPNQRTTLRRTFLMDSTTSIITLTAHMHQLGERFVIRIVGGARDGEIVYETTDWEHPEQKTFTTPLVLQRGQGLMSEITWNNTTSQTVRFGLTSRDEMGIIFGYYY